MMIKPMTMSNIQYKHKTQLGLQLAPSCLTIVKQCVFLMFLVWSHHLTSLPSVNVLVTAGEAVPGESYEDGPQ